MYILRKYAQYILWILAWPLSAFSSGNPPQTTTSSIHAYSALFSFSSAIIIPNYWNVHTVLYLESSCRGVNSTTLQSSGSGGWTLLPSFLDSPVAQSLTRSLKSILGIPSSAKAEACFSGPYIYIFPRLVTEQQSIPITLLAECSYEFRFLSANTKTPNCPRHAAKRANFPRESWNEGLWLAPRIRNGQAPTNQKIRYLDNFPSNESSWRLEIACDRSTSKAGG
jgi:hypothetical protein